MLGLWEEMGSSPAVLRKPRAPSDDSETGLMVQYENIGMWGCSGAVKLKITGPHPELYLVMLGGPWGARDQNRVGCIKGCSLTLLWLLAIRS